MRPAKHTAISPPPLVLVLLTTYERPDQDHHTLRAIAGEGASTAVIAVQDGGGRYAVNETVQGMPVIGIWKPHGGRRLYWQTINQLWRTARDVRPTFIVQLPDDFTYEPGWLAGILAHYRALGCQGVLNILPCHRQRQWRIERELVGGIYHNSFIDGAFITTPAVLDKLRWKVHPVDPMWHAPGRSTGVWAQITRRLKGLKAPMFQLLTSPVGTTFDPAISKMNPDRIDAVLR